MAEPASFVGERGLRSFRDAVAVSLVPQEIVAERRHAFVASVAAEDAAGMTVLGTSVTPVRARRRIAPDSDDSSVFILYAVSGSGELTHRRGVERVAAGSTIVIPAAESFDVSYAERSSLVFVCVPGAVAESYGRLHGPIRSVPLGRVGRVVTSALEYLPGGGDPAAAAAVRAVVELAATGGASASTLRDRADRVIDEHLGDFRLGLGFLAGALGVSPRTLERAFDGEGVAHAVRQRRLEAAAQRLRAHPAVPVSAIAADLGFGSASRFAAHFRERFGQSPRDWRG
ncbi:AraC family transcriptional regulator [Schumannella luteola]